MKSGIAAFAFAAMFTAFGVQEADGVRGPEVWLEFMGGNVRKDGLGLDLEAIKGAGLSGVHFFHIHRNDVGVWPDCRDQVLCMSDKWFDAIRFLGDECERLGLALTVQNCPGWSQSGGPWIDLDHCQRDLAMSRADFSEGETYCLPEIPNEFRDVDSDWRDIAVLAFKTPEGDRLESELKSVSVSVDGDVRTYRFAEPVTVRSVDFQPCVLWNKSYTYHQPWLRIRLDVSVDGKWKNVVATPVPTSNWRDYALPLTVACGEQTGSEWRVTVEHDYPIVAFRDPVFRSSARHTDWQGKSGRTLRSLLRQPPPEQGRASWIDPATAVDITGNDRWIVPKGRWTVVRCGHVNSKRVNSPAPKSATGWECDKLDPKGIEACFDGYIRRLNEGVLKGKMRAMLVDSWECFGQTWTASMERYFEGTTSYRLRPWLPALFGWIVGSPSETERFLTDWRRTNGELITKNYYGRMSELARESGIEAYYETAFGDVVCGDILEYWKYCDAPMCEFWHPHSPMSRGHVGCFAYKSIRPCASAAHIYGKRRVMAEAFTEWGGFHGTRSFAIYRTRQIAPLREA